MTRIAFIDSTSIAVCHNKRISRNQVFKGIAKRGKTTAGWFYGFKLHLIINDKGYISEKIMKKLLEQGIQLFTTLKSNMKQKLMPLKDKILLRKRSIIETVNDQLKNISQIELRVVCNQSMLI